MIASPVVEMARAGDAPAIADMSRALIEHGLPWGWRAARVRRAIADAETNVAVVRERDGLAGFGIMKYADDFAHLFLFAVAADRQRRGIGTALLAWLEASARAAGAAYIRAEARRDNAPARCFYNANGYHEQRIRRAMYGIAVDGVRLEKWLRAPPDESPRT